MVVPNTYSSCDNKSVQVKPVRVLLQDILRKSQEETTADMVAMLPETIVQNCDINSLEAAQKPYTCSLCNKSFTQNDTMIIHMRTHTEEKPFTCILCSKPCSTKSNLNSHMQIHTGEKPFSCLICNKMFVRKTHVKRHIQTHTGEKLYSCSQCNKSYTRPCSLRSHMMSHTSENPFYDVIEGSVELPRKSTSQNVVSKDDVAVKVCKCEELNENKCENTPLGIKEEMVDKQRHYCLADNCKFKTKQSNSNGKIEQEPKVNKTTYSCSICMWSFATYYRLKFHMQKHTQEKPFTCTVCSKAFSKNCRFIAHMRIHRGEKPFSCTLCKKLFSNRSNMKTHMRTHSGEKPFPCLICKKLFSERSNMKAHMRTHSGEKPFSCSYCNKSFSHRISFKAHMLSHTRKTFPLRNTSSPVRGITHMQ